MKLLPRAVIAMETDTTDRKMANLNNFKLVKIVIAAYLSYEIFYKLYGLFSNYRKPLVGKSTFIECYHENHILFSKHDFLDAFFSYIQ